jgi:8-oxo-dGTP pyrophosphatase MutT (NUDIX family)
MYKLEDESINSNNNTFELEDNNISKKKFKKIKFKNGYCGNCGKNGHVYKNCNDPITSYGVILLKVDDIDNDVNDKLVMKLTGDDISRESVEINTDGIKYENIHDIRTFCNYRNSIKFLLIRRKHTLGYIEFVRGRYNIEHVDGIIFLFEQMTTREIIKIGSSTFDELWDELWLNSKNKSIYNNEYNISNQKFKKLKNENDNYLNLDFYVDNVVPNWDYAEWGFPKGRRNYQETDFMCANREFQEETGFIDDDYIILDQIKAINEKLIGTNGIGYKHIYYPAISDTNKQPVIDKDNKHQVDEIGDIGWFTYDEAMKLIRPYHTERKKILTELYMYIMNNISKIYS